MLLNDFAPGRATRVLSKPGIGKTPWPMKRVVPRFRLMVEDVAKESGNNPEAATPAMMWFAMADELVVMRMILNDQPVDQLATVAFGVSQGELPAPEWVIYAAEGWATEPTPGIKSGEDYTLEPNELHDRHMIGMSGVNEGIVANMAARNGTGWVFMQTYTRVGSERLEWGEGNTSDLEQLAQAFPDERTHGRVDRHLRIMVGLREWDGF